jgi:hypothetical protein
MNLNAIRLSPDLNGHIFVKPFNNYCSYYHERFSGATSMQKVALLVHLIITSLFGALLGLLALFGMIFKILDSSTVNKHNKSAFTDLNVIEAGFLHAGGFSCSISSDCHRSGYEYNNAYSTIIDTRGNENISARISEIKEKVKEFTDKMRKIYLNTEAIQIEGRGAVLISLRTLEPIYE